MNTEHGDEVWMNEQARVTLDELAALSGLSASTLRELVECGALMPVNPHEEGWTFSGYCVVAIRRAVRLRNDFDLEPNALALTFSLLERIQVLEDRLRGMRAQTPRCFD